MQFWSNGAEPQYLGQLVSDFQLKGLREFALRDDEGQFLVPVKTMQCSIEDRARDFGELGAYLRRHHVPVDADQYADPRTASTIYSWRVGSVDLDLYERIFDFETFQPHDESRDPEYVNRIQEMDRNRMWGDEPLTYATLKNYPPYVGGAVTGGPVNSVSAGPVIGKAASGVIFDELTNWSSTPSLPSFSPDSADLLRRAATAVERKTVVSGRPEARTFNPWTSAKKLFF